MKDALSIVLAGIAALAVVIVKLYTDWRKDKKNNEERVKEMHAAHINMTKEFTDATLKMAESVTKSANATDSISKVVDKNTVVTGDAVNVLTEISTLLNLKKRK